MANLIKKLAFATMLAGAMVLTLSADRPAGAQDATSKPSSQPASKPGTPPPAPDELFAQYIKALKESPEYALARICNSKDVSAAVEKWGYKLRLVREMRFWQVNLAVHSVVVKLPDGSSANLQYLNPPTPSRAFLIIARDGAPRQPYAISNAQLADEALQIMVVEGLNVLEPSRVPLEEFRVDNQNLADIVKWLCQKGDIGFAFREDLARSIVLTMDLRGKSVEDCFAVISHMTGWKISWMWNDDIHDGLTSGFGVDALSRKGCLDPGANPFDVLKRRFEEAMQAQNRPTVILTAPANCTAKEDNPPAGQPSRK